ncbi:MAG: hypothetical protein GC161_09715 [Planctomycetaceae bacterium]|nr:hypothetical protein [Planctomycetaceae bacterium]
MWSFWWEFNKDRYLNLKQSLASGVVTTGESDFFLGQGQREGAKDSIRPDASQIKDTIVPALKEALRTESSPDILTGAMIALAKIGDPASSSESPPQESEFATIIRGFLTSGSQEVRETAAVALGILAHPSQIDLLIARMQDEKPGRDAMGSTTVDQRTRAFAAYGLALVGSRLGADDDANRVKIVEALASVLNADREALPDISVAAMIAMGLVQLESVPIEGDMPKKVEIPKTREEQIVFALEYLDSDKPYMVRAHAPTAVGRLLTGIPAPAGGSKGTNIRNYAVDKMLPAITKSGSQQEIRGSVALAMGLIGNRSDSKVDKEIRDALIDAAKDATQQTKNFALIALGKIGARMDTANGDSGFAVVEKHLLTQLGSAKGNQEDFAGLAIGVLGHALQESNNQALPRSLYNALAEKLRGAKNENNVGAFSIAAGMTQEEGFRATLLKLLDETAGDEPRGYVAVALGMARVNEAKERIQKIVKESEYRPDLLKQAAIALGLLGDREIVPDLLKMLADSKGLAAQASITSALGFIGDRRSVEPLVDMLKNESLTDLARGFAAVALGIVADKEDLPWNSKIGEDLNYRASTSTLNDQGGTGILNIL